MTNEELINEAASLINVRADNGNLIGDVGCVLVSGKGNVYYGVCAAVGSNVFCAEQSAIGSMLTAGEYDVKKIVATWKDEKGNVFVIPPCGNCRQLMYQMNHANLDTDVILDKAKLVKLRELLPYYDWWKQVS